MKIFIGADHAGFNLKEKIKQYLVKLNVKYEDLGSFDIDKQDDYPDFAIKVARMVKNNKDSRGIIICDTGIGVCITANKVKGIMAANVFNKKMASRARQHNNTNILCLGHNHISFYKAKKIIKAWLNTEFSHASRHQRRLNKIKEIE
ncbi:ribose 5-phosphate isomerase B [Patescibacteria group bacterium]|nr:ribose 5-phosphate isomerase B [Patescibacteria group bacterium]